MFVIAEAVILFLNRYFPQLDAKLESYSPTPYSDTVVLSVLLGIVLPVVGNLFYGSARAARRTANDSGDLIELLIAESIEEQKPVEISLRSGKSYIGFALESGVARHGEPDVSIIPMASGYRDRDTQELEITTHYATVIQESLKQPSGISDLDFRVVIPITEIVSARVFLPEVYELFEELKEKNS